MSGERQLSPAEKAAYIEYLREKIAKGERQKSVRQAEGEQQIAGKQAKLDRVTERKNASQAKLPGALRNHFANVADECRNGLERRTP